MHQSTESNDHLVCPRSFDSDREAMAMAARTMERRLVPRVSETVVECEEDSISAEEFVDETWLLRVAKSNFQRFAGLASHSIYPTKSVVTWGSLCSGSEGPAFVMRAISCALNRAKQPVRFVQRFSCELNKDKRAWISCVCASEERVMKKLERKMKEKKDEDKNDKHEKGRGPGGGSDSGTAGDAILRAFQDTEGRRPGVCDSDNEAGSPADDGSDSEKMGDEDSSAESGSGQSVAAQDVADMPCLFTDIKDMGEKMAPCSCHASGNAASCKCYVPAVDVLIAGTSCKDISRANQNKKRDREEATFGLLTSRGGSAQTFRGLVQYIKSTKPAVVVFENVDNLDEGSQSGMSNQQILMDELSRLGYEGQPTICEASRFGCSCRRRRCYIFFVQVAANPTIDLAARDVQACFKDFRMFLSSCMRGGPSLEKLLLPSDDPSVLAELRVRQDKQKNAEPASAARAAEWPEQHMQFAQNIRAQWAQRPAEHLQQNPWFHTLTVREKSALPLLQQQLAPKTSMIRDLSQSITRANSVTWQEDALRHIGPTLLSRQMLWAEAPAGSSSQSRLMLGREALRLQGFPVMTLLQDISEKFVKKSSADISRTQSGKHLPQDGTQSGKDQALMLPEAGAFSESLIMWDLAGNGMSLPVLMAVVQSAFCCLAWRTGETEIPLADQDAVRAACEAVDLLDQDAPVVTGMGQGVAEGPSGLMKRRRAR